ncbi:MAG: hypothetical protein KF873_02170 [Gemmataceae bacterium]|nr:hypothetical protein [Gemmataceae bacterium]
MPRSRRDDDDDDFDREYERELARERARQQARRDAGDGPKSSFKTGFGLAFGGFFGFLAARLVVSIVTGIFLLIVTAIGIRSCVFVGQRMSDEAKALEVERQAREAEANAANQKARAERERLQLAREAEAKRMAGAIAVGELVQVTAVAPIGATREVLQTLLKATAENNERELLKLAEARTTSRVAQGDRCTVLSLSADVAQVRIAEGPNAGDWWIEAKHLAHIPRKIE